MHTWIEDLKELDSRDLYINIQTNLLDVEEHNFTHTDLTSSNSCLYFLGYSAQADFAMFYLYNYLNKDDTDLGQSLPSLITESQNHIKKYPSTADDSGTINRIVQHTLTRIRNTLSAQRELCDTQALLILLGGQVYYSSDTFAYYRDAECVKL